MQDTAGTALDLSLSSFPVAYFLFGLFYNSLRGALLWKTKRLDCA